MASRATSNPRTDIGSASAQALAQLVTLEAALAGITLVSPGGLSTVETTRAEGLRQAALRLVEISDQVDADGLTVAGSTGQTRPHPLLAEERALRREIADQLTKLELRVNQRVQFERVRAMTRATRAASPAPATGSK